LNGEDVYLSYFTDLYMKDSSLFKHSLWDPGKL